VGSGPAADSGQTENSPPSDRDVVWPLVFCGSRYQYWTWTVAPGPGFWDGLAVQRAFRSWDGLPLQLPLLPLRGVSPPRWTGGTTQLKLVPEPQGLAWRPFVPQKNWPFTLPSTPLAVTTKPLAAVALATPTDDSVAWQPLADVPAVQ